MILSNLLGFPIKTMNWQRQEHVKYFLTHQTNYDRVGYQILFPPPFSTWSISKIKFFWKSFLVSLRTFQLSLMYMFNFFSKIRKLQMVNPPFKDKCFLLYYHNNASLASYEFKTFLVLFKHSSFVVMCVCFVSLYFFFVFIC